MRRILSISIYLLLASLFINSCDQAPLFPLEPRIEFVDIQPKVVKQLQDSILITFRYQDGDGNIGDNPEQINNLIIIDSRIGNTLTEEQATNKFTLPNLKPDANNPSIQGEIKIKLDFTIKTTAAAEEQVRYQIKLWDSANNAAKPIDGSDGAIYTDFITIVR